MRTARETSPAALEYIRSPGIVAIVPHEMAIAVWSPELDDAGNSLAGIAVLEQLTKQLGRSVY